MNDTQLRLAQAIQRAREAGFHTFAGALVCVLKLNLQHYPAPERVRAVRLTNETTSSKP